LFLVESYGAASEDTLTQACECARNAAELGPNVHYVRTTYVPGDEMLLHVFEAPSLEELAEAARIALLDYERITTAVEGSADLGSVFTTEDNAQ
jgi:hypothetical protein